MTPARKTILISIIVLLAFLAAFGHYTHRGYVGVLESGDSLRLLDHGFHLRAPWQRVMIYPLRPREVRVEIFDEGPDVRIHFDAVLYVGVRRDSIPSLHKAYRGAYMERVVSPMLSEFLREHAEALDPWNDAGRQTVTSVVLDFLGPEAGEYGINVTHMWLRSFEVERATGGLHR